jgi:hexosaminidase
MVRGFHLDLRIQVMRMEALKSLATRLKGLGITTLVMEWEASYPFSSHPLIPNRYAYRPSEIASFMRHARNLGMDVIPLQQSFGHLEYLLRHPRYQSLREDSHNHSQLCPLEAEGCKRLLGALMRELAASHPSEYFHIGGDEARLLGHCPRCKALAKRIGSAGLYARHIGMVARIVQSLGRRPLLWADMVLKHPEALAALPKTSVLVDWNYGWNMDHFGDHAALVRSGLEIWGAPALRSDPDNYFLVDWGKHLRNIRDFIPRGRALGYGGWVMTSWSTSGEYSRVMESTSDAVALLPLRRVYPLEGFSLPLAAYAQALDSKDPLEIEAFVQGYCLRQYGLEKSQAKRFWKALTAAPYEVRQGRVEGPLGIPALLTRSAEAATVLRRLRPNKGLREFEHYRLLADIRLQYLRYQAVEADINAASADAARFRRARRRVAALRRAAPGLDRRFKALHASSLHPGALAEENQLRRAKIDQLHDTLSQRR